MQIGLEDRLAYLTDLLENLVLHALSSRNMFRQMLQPLRRREAVRNDERAELEKFGRDDGRFLCGYDYAGVQMSLLADDAEEGLGKL